MRIFLRAISFLVVIVTLSACGDGETLKPEENEPKRIGVLLGVNAFASTVNGFKAGLTELGYIEGQNVTYDVRSAHGKKPQMEEIAQAFVKDKVDLIFSITNGASLVAKHAVEGTDIPVFFAIVLAPVRSGVVDNMLHPSGKVTGIRNPADEYIGKKLEFLRQMDPNAKRIWTPVERAYPTTRHVLPRMHEISQTLGMEIIETDVTDKADIIAFLNERKQPDFDAIFIMPNMVPQQPEAVAAMMAYGETHNIPLLANTPPQVKAGALLSYVVNPYQTGKQAANMVSRILKTENYVPGPVVNSEPELIINTKTADKLGLHINEELKSFAVEFFE